MSRMTQFEIEGHPRFHNAVTPNAEATLHYLYTAFLPACQYRDRCQGFDKALLV